MRQHAGSMQAAVNSGKKFSMALCRVLIIFDSFVTAWRFVQAATSSRPNSQTEITRLVGPHAGCTQRNAQ